MCSDGGPFAYKTVTAVSGSTVTFSATQSILNGVATQNPGLSIYKDLFEGQVLLEKGTTVFQGGSVVKSFDTLTMTLDNYATSTNTSTGLTNGVTFLINS